MTNPAEGTARASARRRSPRRWPTALAGAAVVAALLLTGWLVIRDRDNAAAASSSPANARRDAIAVRSLREMGQSLDLAETMQHEGIFGLRDIGLHDYAVDVVQPLGGTLTTSRSGWTLALGGGWACLTWEQAGSGWSWAKVTRGICSGAPIDETPSVPAPQVLLAIGRLAQVQHAAVVAAYATYSVAPAVGTFSVQTITHQFRELKRLPFRWSVTPHGLTVATHLSLACLQPSVSQNAVRVELGACP